MMSKSLGKNASTNSRTKNGAGRDDDTIAGCAALMEGKDSVASEPAVTGEGTMSRRLKRRARY